MNGAALDAASILTVERLTPPAFSPFGDVIAFGAASKVFPINHGTTMRHHGLARVEVGAGDGHTCDEANLPRTWWIESAAISS